MSMSRSRSRSRSWPWSKYKVRVAAAGRRQARLSLSRSMMAGGGGHTGHMAHGTAHGAWETVDSRQSTVVITDYTVHRTSPLPLPLLQPSSLPSIVGGQRESESESTLSCVSLHKEGAGVLAHAPDAPSKRPSAALPAAAACCLLPAALPPTTCPVGLASLPHHDYNQRKPKQKTKLDTSSLCSHPRMVTSAAPHRTAPHRTDHRGQTASDSAAPCHQWRRRRHPHASHRRSPCRPPGCHWNRVESRRLPLVSCSTTANLPSKT
jgi:hypothetical protein